MKNSNPNFHEFPKTTFSDWEEAAKKLLKGKDPNEALTWSSIEDVDLKAYYDHSTAEGLGYIAHTLNQSESKEWIQYERIDVTESRSANQHPCL